jgi:hypothetical protein
LSAKTYRRFCEPDVNDPCHIAAGVLFAHSLLVWGDDAPLDDKILHYLQGFGAGIMFVDFSPGIYLLVFKIIGYEEER